MAGVKESFKEAYGCPVCKRRLPVHSLVGGVIVYCHYCTNEIRVCFELVEKQRSNKKNSREGKHRHRQVIRRYLLSSLNRRTYELRPIEEFLLRPEDSVEITDEQKKDYEKYEYLCYDKIHIPGKAPMKRSNELNVNGHTIKMPDEPFRLLIELVVALKKGKGGWLTKFTEVGKYQIYDRLRSPLAGNLLEKDKESAKKFIENNASKQYRISTHPDFVTYDRGNLLKHADPEVRKLAKKLSKDDGGGRRRN